MTKIFPFLLSALLILSSCEPNPTDTSSSADTSSTTDSSSQTETSSDPVIIYEDYYNDYYDSIESWENGEDLREQLNELINFDVTLVEFDGSDRWAVNQKADETFDNFDRVNLVYADYQPLKTYTNNAFNKGWQREHAFAQSLGDFDSASQSRTENESLVMRSDFHNLFASDGSLNGSRNNLNLGNITEQMLDVTNPPDSYGNPSECHRSDSAFIFEPPEKDKPMLARAIFYMATRFDDLQIIEEVAPVRSKAHGMLNDLLDWSKSPITRREYKHNIGVYSFQNNRNPYIDFPELVDYVFGDKQDEAGELNKMRPSYYDVVLDGGEEQASEIHNLGIKYVSIIYQVGHTFSKIDDLKVFTVNNDLSVNANLSASDFSVSLADGYEFVANDVGTISVNVTYQQLAVSYEIEIEADPSLLATYHYLLTNADAFAALRDKTELAGIINPISLGSLDFNFYFQSGKVSSFQGASGQGRQFGTKDESIISMYIETLSDFIFDEKTNVNAVYVVASTAASGVNPKIDVSIGSYSFPQQSMVIGTAGSNTLYEFVLPEGQSYTGKVRIAFSGFTGGALYLNRFAINAV